MMCISINCKHRCKQLFDNSLLQTQKSFRFGSIKSNWVMFHKTLHLRCLAGFFWICICIGLPFIWVGTKSCSRNTLERRRFKKNLGWNRNFESFPHSRASFIQQIFYFRSKFLRNTSNCLTCEIRHNWKVMWNFQFWSSKQSYSWKFINSNKLKHSLLYHQSSENVTLGICDVKWKKDSYYVKYFFTVLSNINCLQRKKFTQDAFHWKLQFEWKRN